MSSGQVGYGEILAGELPIGKADSGRFKSGRQSECRGTGGCGRGCLGGSGGRGQCDSRGRCERGGRCGGGASQKAASDSEFAGAEQEWHDEQNPQGFFHKIIILAKDSRGFACFWKAHAFHKVGVWGVGGWQATRQHPKNLFPPPFERGCSGWGQPGFLTL